MDIELLDIAPDIQCDPDERENEACSQPGTNISIFAKIWRPNVMHSDFISSSSLILALLD